MAEKDPKRGLEDDDIKFIEDSERLTRIVSTLLKTFEEDKESLRSEGRKLQEELLKLQNSAKSNKGKKDIEFVIQLLKEYGEQRVGPKNFVSKLKNLLEINSQEIELLRRQIKENTYTIDRTGKKLTGATAKIRELQEQYRAKVAEVNGIVENNKLTLAEREKRIDELEKEINTLRNNIGDLLDQLQELYEKNKNNENFVNMKESYTKQIQSLRKEMRERVAEGEFALQQAQKTIQDYALKLQGQNAQYQRQVSVTAKKQAELVRLRREYQTLTERFNEISNENSGNAEERQRLQSKLNGLRREIIVQEIYKQFNIKLISDSGKERIESARFELNQHTKKAEKKTKEEKRNNKTSSYDRTVQGIINSLQKDGIEVSYKEVDDIIKEERDFGKVFSHPRKALKILREKDEEKSVDKPTKKGIKLKLASLATLAVLATTMVFGGTIFAVHFAHDSMDKDPIITQREYQIQEEELSAMIKEGSAFIYDTEENADKKMQGMGANSNGFVSLTVDDHVVELYNEIKDASEKTSEIIVLDENNVPVDGLYMQTKADFDEALKTTNTTVLDECITTLQDYVNNIGNASTIVKGNNEEIVTASADTSTNVTYYQQANQAWNEMNSYLDQQYSEIIDLATTPVLDVNFDVNEIKSDADLTDILTNGTGAVKDVLSCKYERETGKVSMLIECVSMKGSYTVETKFNMTPNLKVVDSHTIADGMKEAGYNITSTKFDTTLSSGLEDTNVTMSVNGEKVSGKAKILYNIDAVYFENQGKNGTTKVTADAIVMITQEDGTIDYRTFEYDTNIAGKVDEKEVESDVLTELINKINASLDQEVQVDNNVEMENE